MSGDRIDETPLADGTNLMSQVMAMAREQVRRQGERELHRMSSLPARTDEEKAARARARAERKRQKLARRRNRR